MNNFENSPDIKNLNKFITLGFEDDVLFLNKSILSINKIKCIENLLKKYKHKKANHRSKHRSTKKSKGSIFRFVQCRQ